MCVNRRILTLIGIYICLCSLIGGATIAIGFYAVMWAQAQEEIVKNDFASSSSSSPLMSSKAIDA